MIDELPLARAAALSGPEGERDFRRSCLGKNRYDTIDDAEEAAIRRRRIAHDPAQGTPDLLGYRISTYKCRHCAGYHIGHRTVRRERIEVAK